MGQFKPTSTIYDSIAGAQSAARPTNARHNFPSSDGLSREGASAFLLGAREALDGMAELAAIALGVPATFICLEIDDHCRVVASHGLSDA